VLNVVFDVKETLAKLFKEKKRLEEKSKNVDLKIKKIIEMTEEVKELLGGKNAD
jgi:ABC-type enterochelin transport system substrate-binding protein